MDSPAALEIITGVFMEGLALQGCIHFPVKSLAYLLRLHQSNNVDAQQELLLLLSSGREGAPEALAWVFRKFLPQRLNTSIIHEHLTRTFFSLVDSLDTFHTVSGYLLSAKDGTGPTRLRSWLDEALNEALSKLETAANTLAPTLVSLPDPDAGRLEDVKIQMRNWFIFPESEDDNLGEATSTPVAAANPRLKRAREEPDELNGTDAVDVGGPEKKRIRTVGEQPGAKVAAGPGEGKIHLVLGPMGLNFRMRGGHRKG
ncbi:hypothetical protein C8R43DRAFT_1032636, partial [Mycena crocata]